MMLLAPSAVYATDPSVNVTVNMPAVLELWLTKDGLSVDHLYWTPENFNDQVTVTQLKHGHTTTQAVTVHMCTNVPWKILIRGTSEYFTHSANPLVNKPVSDIQWCDGGLDFTSLKYNEDDQVESSETSAPNCIDYHFDLHFKILLHACTAPGEYNDEPGTYDYNTVQVTLAMNS